MADKVLTPENLQLVGTLFDSDRARLLADAAQLLKPVGDQGSGPLGRQVQTDDVPLDVFGQAATFNASGTGTVEFFPAATAAEDLFVDGETYTAPTSAALASLDLQGKLSLGTSIPPLAMGALTLSITGSASAEGRYRHLLPVFQNQTQGAALAELAATTRLPQLVRLDQIRPGEVHRLDALINLSFGLEARWGRDLDLQRVVGLWSGLSAEVQAHVAATIQATLGWSLYEEMRLTVGRANLLDPDRVRIRLQRVDQRRFTLGAVAQLMVNYDASSVAAILQQTLDQSPLPRIVSALRPIAAGDWDAIKGQITDRAAATLDELLDDTGWKDWLANSPEVADLVKLANTVIDAYDGLGAQVQSLWDRVLGAADLGAGGELRQALDKVAGLQGKSVLDLITNADLRSAIEMFEALAGKSVEDVLLDGAPQQIVDRAAGLAKKAINFLDGVPQQVTDRIQGYADKLGITKTLSFLRANASSKQALTAAIEGAAQKRIRQLVERLVGKAWDLISDDDLKRVQAWAGILVDSIDSLQKRLTDVLAKFKGELGFSLSLSLDRLTRTEALVDLEIDPRDPRLAASIPKALLAGNVRALLEALPDLTDDQPPTYMLREGALSHRKVRTHTLSVVFNFLGLKSLLRNQSQWTEESTLTFQQTDSGFKRTGSYAGGLVRTSTVEAESEGAVWLEIAAADEGVKSALAPFAPAAISRGMRLSYSYSDPKTQVPEQAALDELLAALGFINVPGSMNNVSRKLGGATVETRFAITLTVNGQGVDDFLGRLDVEPTWNAQYLAAAKHWFLDPPSPRQILGRPLGATLAALIDRSDFRSSWVQPSPGAFTAAWAGSGGKPVTVDGKGFNPPLLRKGVPPASNPDDVARVIQQWTPEFDSLPYLSWSRPRGLAALRDLAPAVAAAVGSGGHDQLVAVAGQAARAFVDVHPGGLADLKVSWDSPLFLAWLVLVRLSPAARKAVRGVATLRWRQPGDTNPWQDPLVWQLTGLPSAV